ncbi:MAG: DUF1707 and DUF2154 domain-containing protein [Cytophagales bacterium]|nr:MAG: DUF1707 and DUF2154 domain-containing protein [Cytophagales bacterium]
MKTVYGLPKKREEVITVLQDAFSNQNLDDAEYESRLNEALAAKSIEDLEMTVFDFPAKIKNQLFPKDATTVQATQSSHLPSVRSNDNYRVVFGQDRRQISQIGAEAINFLSVMSSQIVDFRKSQLQGNQFKIYVECLLGKTVIDLRNEDLSGKEIDIWIGGGLGEIEILVPQGGNIRQEAQFFGGNFTTKDKRKSWLNRLMGKQHTEKQSIAFTLTLRGNYWLGNVSVIC